MRLSRRLLVSVNVRTSTIHTYPCVPLIRQIRTLRRWMPITSHIGSPLLDDADLLLSARACKDCLTHFDFIVMQPKAAALVLEARYGMGEVATGDCFSRMHSNRQRRNQKEDRVRHALGHHDTASDRASDGKVIFVHHLACTFWKGGWVGVFCDLCAKICCVGE